MLVGIMSDSHGRSDMVKRALTLFDELNVKHIFHCGDVGDQDVFDEFVGRRFSFVWGNCDIPDGGTREYLRTVGIAEPSAVPLICNVGGKTFAVFHGHEREFTRLDRIDADYVLCGHSHQRRDERIGTLRIINPGALHRANPKTVATLNTENDALQFHEISDF